MCVVVELSEIMVSQEVGFGPKASREGLQHTDKGPKASRLGPDSQRLVYLCSCCRCKRTVVAAVGVEVAYCSRERREVIEK